MTERPKTSDYCTIIEPHEGELMAVPRYLSAVKARALTDYDGFGYAAKDGMMADFAASLPHSELEIKPSQGSKRIPEDATHIVWYNR